MSVLPPWSQWNTDKNLYEKQLHLIYTWTAIYGNYWQHLHCIMGYSNLEIVGFVHALSISWEAPEHPYLWVSTGYWDTKE